MKKFFLVIVIGVLLAGPALSDNSRFYGSFTVAAPECKIPEKLIFGDELSRYHEDWYIYIPLNENTYTYNGLNDKNEFVNDTTTITENTIHFKEVGQPEKGDPGEPNGGWSAELTFEFGSDFNVINYTLIIIDYPPDDPCNGPLTGSATRTLTKPSTPTLLAPSNGSVDVSVTTIITTNAFSDPDPGDTHQQTEWQISNVSDFTSDILNETSAIHLTSLPIPNLLLRENTTYYWRVRFYDNTSTASEWSEIFFFNTAQIQNDTNDNGIPDTLENDTVDLDEDGTADIEQTDVIKTLNTVVGSGQMGVSIKASTTVTQIVEINSIDPDDISKYIRPHTMPLGMLSFKLNVTNPGDTAHVKIHFSEAAPEDASWYFHDSINGWTDYSQHATFSDDRKSASVQLKDGGHGDSDGVANGVIVDPCGFGIASWLKGKVSDSATSEGLTKSIVSISDIGLTLNTILDGNFLSMILPGTYDIDVSTSGYQTEALSDIEVVEADIVTQDVKLTGRCKITGLEITGTPSESNPVKLKVNAQSGSETINYRYSVHGGYGTSSYDGSHWLGMTSSEYQTVNSCDYTFDTSEKSIVVAWATSSGTDSVDPTGIPIIGWSVDTSDSACKTNFTGVTITGEQKVNEKITFAVNAENSCGTSKYYRFSMHPYYGTSDYDGSHWQGMTSSEWISSNSTEYTFTEAGKYIIVVWVSDDTSSVDPDGIPIIGWSVDIE